MNQRQNFTLSVDDGSKDALIIHGVCYDKEKKIRKEEITLNKNKHFFVRNMKKEGDV